jgi:hypothetical protein
VTRPDVISHASPHIHGQDSDQNLTHGEHIDSTVNKRMRLTRSSTHSEEKCPENPHELSIHGLKQVHGIERQPGL